MGSSPDYLQRAINAERIASVIAHKRGHSFEKHKDEFGGDLNAFRQAVIDTLTDPKTAVVKISNDLYRFYNKASNIMVMIDRTAMDWGTAFRPDGNRGMMLMRERGIPIHENGNVTYLNKLNNGFFVKQNRLHQEPEPIHLSSLSREQSAEVLLSIFDRIDHKPAQNRRLHSTFNAASLHVMPDMIARIQRLPEDEKAILRDCSHKYKMASQEGFAALDQAGLNDFKQNGRNIDVMDVLRDPQSREAFIDELETRYALAETAAEEELLDKMLNACETFGVLDQIRAGALNQTCEMIDQMKQKARSEPSLSFSARQREPEARVLSTIRTS